MVKENKKSNVFRSSYDVVGNIAIMKFSDDAKKSDKIKEAKRILSERKSVRTVIEKADRIKGRLRTIKSIHLAGEKNLVAEYIENGCRFKFNIETCYFSPRLANERKKIYEIVKKNENVLVMFAGVGPFPIEIAKHSLVKEVYSVEIGRECSKYAEENVLKNKVNNVKVIQGDVKRVMPLLKNKGIKFDRIVMARPNLKESFVKYALMAAKKNSLVHYYGFGDDKDKIVEQIKEDCLKEKRKIKILKIEKAGDIAPFKFRWRIDFRVL